MSTSVIRHHWVEQALASFREHFLACGYTIPDNVRVSIGFTKSNNHARRLGQCVDKSNSTDGHYEMFISPIVGATGQAEADRLMTINILETIAHELVHATVGNEAGHRGAFVVCAGAVGFLAPWRFTPSGPTLQVCIDRIIATLGLFPSGAVVLKKKQGKSLVKCMCEGCDYVAYITQKTWRIQVHRFVLLIVKVCGVNNQI